MAVLVREVLARTSALLNDDAPQFYRWGEIPLVDLLNEAQSVLCKFLPSAFSRIDAIKLKAGTRQSIALIAAADCKPGDGPTPDAPILGNQFMRGIRNMGADGLTPGRAIRPMDQKVLDCDPSWHTRPPRKGEAISGYTYDPTTPRHFYVVPAVPATGLWIEVAYAALPKAIPAGGASGSEKYLAAGSSAETIGVPDEHMDDLVNYTVARANMIDAEWANASKAAAFTGLFLASLNAKVAVLTGASPNLKRLPFAPEPIGAAS